MRNSIIEEHIKTCLINIETVTELNYVFLFDLSDISVCPTMRYLPYMILFRKSLPIPTTESYTEQSQSSGESSLEDSP